MKLMAQRQRNRSLANVFNVVGAPVDEEQKQEQEQKQVKEQQQEQVQEQKQQQEKEQVTEVKKEDKIVEIKDEIAPVEEVVEVDEPEEIIEKPTKKKVLIRKNFKIKELENNYLEELEQEQKRKKKLKELEKKEKTNKTFSVDNDLLEIILELSEKYGYGFQAKFINTAIKRELIHISENNPFVRKKLIQIGVLEEEN